MKTYISLFMQFGSIPKSVCTLLDNQPQRLFDICEMSLENTSFFSFKMMILIDDLGTFYCRLLKGKYSSGMQGMTCDML